MSGQEIAMWVQKNHKNLKVKYIIWGQRIWNPTHSGDTEGLAWAKWRDMENRNSITDNHWWVPQSGRGMGCTLN